MLLQHLLVICLLNYCNNLLFVGLDILPYLLQQEDVLPEFLLLLLNTFQTGLLATVQLFQVLFNAQLDSSLDLLIMLLEG